jgi:hypothetical protein
MSIAVPIVMAQGEPPVGVVGPKLSGLGWSKEPAHESYKYLEPYQRPCKSF